MILYADQVIYIRRTSPLDSNDNGIKDGHLIIENTTRSFSSPEYLAKNWLNFAKNCDRNFILLFIGYDESEAITAEESRLAGRLRAHLVS